MQLEWVDHSVQLLEGVSDLLKGSKLVDVTITAEGKKIKAHRLILSAASTYFRVSSFEFLLWQIRQESSLRDIGSIPLLITMLAWGLVDTRL